MTTLDTPQTLAQRIADGRLATAEAQRFAMLLADRLRQLHDQGRIHGVLTPDAVLIGPSGLEIVPTRPSAEVTPYTAPELLQGRPADARSDIFAYGAIAYELMTGNPAFEGATPDALAHAILSATPRPTGTLEIDRLVTGCCAKAPDARFQRMQKILLELRLLNNASRRLDPTADAAFPMPEAIRMPSYGTPEPAGPRYYPSETPRPEYSDKEPAAQAGHEAPARTQMEELEARITARVLANEKLAAERNRERYADPMSAFVPPAYRQQAPFPPPYQQPPYQQHPYGTPPGRGYAPEFGGDSNAERLLYRLERTVDSMSERVARLDLTLNSAIDRLHKVERTLEEFDMDAAALRDSVTRDIRNFDRTLKSQTAAVESARTAMGQTDDLVERVVEAIDALQGMLDTSDHREEPPAAIAG